VNYKKNLIKFVGTFYELGNKLALTILKTIYFALAFGTSAH